MIKGTRRAAVRLFGRHVSSGHGGYLVPTKLDGCSWLLSRKTHKFDDNNADLVDSQYYKFSNKKKS